jgi:hypothetical protein
MNIYIYIFFYSNCSRTVRVNGILEMGRNLIESRDIKNMKERLRMAKEPLDFEDRFGDKTEGAVKKLYANYKEILSQLEIMMDENQNSFVLNKIDPIDTNNSELSANDLLIFNEEYDANNNSNDATEEKE